MATNQSYSFEKKLAAVPAFLCGMGKEEVMLTFENRGRGQLDGWIRAYAAEGAEGLRPKRRGRPPTSDV